MPFFRTLTIRAKEDELMDDFSMGGEELSEALQHLRRLNRIFPAAAPTLHGVDKLWQANGRPPKLSILDVGAGSGDINTKLLKWADRKGISLQITLVDMTVEACEEARRLFREEPRVKVIQGNVKDLDERAADIVTGSQFIHHFDGEELVDMVAHMLQASRYGIVINDIHRHAVSYTAVWLMTRLISRNRYIRHDGPLSVAKGFKGRDWRELKAKLKMSSMTYSWRPLFRYSVVIPRIANQSSSDRKGR
ncbi:methyltransferase domain-containing protein [Paenibacillus zeisoli]|uniref:Methyltransferase domain-containing protein n=1 Tax=Paenibacillus zeisoli TaxID=2496267 RepID=A0A433XNS7_9BACL|nr:methyltransferase domain-containing protein [Paenibacillus zeisoli]RUT35730.1 methyltransferase domain-containing protein [Paenibacillus zeisoli]